MFLFFSTVQLLGEYTRGRRSVYPFGLQVSQIKAFIIYSIQVSY